MCEFLTGEVLGSDCNFNAGGVSRVWVAAFDEITAHALNAKGSAVTSITFDAESLKFIELPVLTETVDFQEAYTKSGSNRFMRPTLVFPIPGADSKSIEDAHALLQHKCVFMLELNSGVRKIIGLRSGLEATAGSSNSGIKAEDESGKAFTFTGISLGYSPTITPTISDPYIFEPEEVTP